MQTGQIVTNARTLRALDRAGYIEFRDGTDRHWTGAQVRRRFVSCGPRLEAWYQEFTHHGRRYRLQYFDGCFHPFVVRLDSDRTLPAFV